MRLELGAGDRGTPGFVHNDIRYTSGIDWVFDAAEASAYAGCESCDEIRATHLLEHFSHRRTVAVLKDWLACLKPGGLLYVEVPNFEMQCRVLLAGQHEEAVRLAYGDQDYEGNAHLTGFTARTLFDAAEAAGFTDVAVRVEGLVLAMEARRPNQ
jgi:predicted SAM-dependent methyltransferase